MEQPLKKRVHSPKDMTCVMCGTIVLRVPFYRQSTFKCCSRKCARAYQAEKNACVKACVVCNAGFRVTSTRSESAKYCSNLCKGRAMKGRGSVRHECTHCHAEFWDSPSKNRKYCSRACVNKASKTIWRPTFTAARDNIKRNSRLTRCERCGYDEYPEILGVHHKDRNRENNTPDNLEVLCPNCHSVEHKKHIAHGGHR